MKIINGYEDFQHNVINQNNWLQYYKKYATVFDSLFTYLYQSDLQQLYPMIEGIDWKEINARAKKVQDKLNQTDLRPLIQSCRDFFAFYQEASLFCIVGLGHSDGAAPPSDYPFIYLGLERLEDADLSILIPHEFNHMVRFHTLSEHQSFRVIDLMIAEGLAVLTPLILNKRVISYRTLAEILMMSEQEVKNCSSYEWSFQEDFNSILNEDLMRQYFLKHPNAEYPRIGYFIGTEIIFSLLLNNWSLKELTIMTTDEILQQSFPLSSQGCFARYLSDR
ncbi:DUF2268 domain-containing putative Zn-dependent protease [Jeotgalibacillus sp. R-1-5s-1]|uniref:DUF2268 domain-containing putative Zn-dependent protease n=1 Tax=Jeotgalibacillus sp. R-1-5s-1 TaxID=2555897 RepID=UPI00106D098B|nr:DUF2268 domain-containing putative Zn-dependent protease [Jeotgalibacillus sp. R-1-5s-1]TFD99658.1 hypothetical protein E2491_07110 [Jeotgalibacillus sp. R-1-5s-1]